MIRMSPLFLVLVFAGQCLAYPSFRSAIPNGDSVPHPCIPGSTWNGVGHELVQGQGPLNPFGRNFDEAKYKWTMELCRMDSDGDGKTNGEELGDPNCEWIPDAQPSSRATSHPGVCEPVDSALCKERNGNYLTSIDECAALMNVESANANWCPAVKKPGVQTIELRFNNTLVPSDDTTYYCQQMSVPDLEQYHIIAWEPIIDNYEMLHHLILFTCDVAAEERLKGRPYTTPEHCTMAPQECGDSAIIWAFGQGPRCYSDDHGTPMGKDFFRRALLQLHYNNPSMKSGVRDSSGLRLYYTRRERQYDSGMLGVGQIDIAVAPGQVKKVSARTFLDQQCSSKVLSKFPQFFMSSMLFHMHQTGVYAKLQIEKANGSVISLVDKSVTYDRPVYLTWNKTNAPVLEAGDNFLIGKYLLFNVLTQFLTTLFSLNVNRMYIRW